jgi:hypothetical protein
MARIEGGIGKELSGQVGGVVFVQRYGEAYLRSLPVRAKNSWSERQLLHRKRFKAIAEYCKKYQYTLIRQIWNLAGKNGHGRNLFLKANSPAFALDGRLTEIEKLHFSAGKLPLPQQFRAKRSAGDPSKVEVSWDNDENLSPVFAHDELMMVAGFPDHFTPPIATGVLRKAGTALIDLPAGFETITGIWLFFRAHKKDGYSWDQHFGI